LASGTQNPRSGSAKKREIQVGRVGILREKTRLMGSFGAKKTPQVLRLVANAAEIGLERKNCHFGVMGT
jgi:hypothetical protein